jgi:molecular chaperone GrpE
VTPEQQQPEGITVHDKRRLDPETGEVRPGSDAGEVREPGPAAAEAPEPQGSSREEELLADLQRVTAEYANYRRRVDRDRASVVEHATLAMLESLLPLLDDIERARQHGDLEGPFKSVGERLEQIVERQGLERVGKQGDPFDPAVHEALVHSPGAADVDFPVVAEVLQSGWRLASGRVLRPAGVVVADPPAVPEEGPEGRPEESADN